MKISKDTISEIKYGLIATALYAATFGVLNSIKVTEELRESGLPEKFEQVAVNAPYKVEDYQMDYNGALDTVLAERKEFLAQYDAINIGQWSTTRRTIINPRVSTTVLAVCLNPFRTID
jgi:hypothetical protein